MARDNWVIFVAVEGFLLVILGFILISYVYGVAFLALATTLGIYFMTRESRSENAIGVMLFLASSLAFVYWLYAMRMPEAKAILAVFYFGFLALFLLPFTVISILRTRKRKYF